MTAHNGEIALKTIPRALPDLILLDIVMPGLDGFEVCQRLKADPATQGIPVIFVSARDETADLARGFQLGGVDYITKPIEREEVQVRVETHLKIDRLTKELADSNRPFECTAATRILFANIYLISYN
jgi:DNA-binding response OmpR family regulator